MVVDSKIWEAITQQKNKKINCNNVFTPFAKILSVCVCNPLDGMRLLYWKFRTLLQQQTLLKTQTSTSEMGRQTARIWKIKISTNDTVKSWHNTSWSAFKNKCVQFYHRSYCFRWVISMGPSAVTGRTWNEYLYIYVFMVKTTFLNAFQWAPTKQFP